MRRKIAISLLILVACSAAGSVVSVAYIKRTTPALSRLIRLHQIEELRRNLIIAIQTAQSDLYTVHTPLGKQADEMTENVLRIEDAARRCSSCHHEPEVAARLARMQDRVGDYETALSYYVTASANAQRIESLKLDAARLGTELLASTEEMSFQATRKLEAMTGSAMARIGEVEDILTATMLLTVVVAVVAAARLGRAMSRPVDELVRATRAIAAGELGHRLRLDGRGAEFVELADHFNSMARTLQEQARERGEAAERLRRSEERYALAAQGANDGLWDWDLGGNRVYLSVRWKSMLGYAEGEVGDSPEEWLGRVHTADRAALEAKISAHVTGQAHHLECEYRIRHADGSFLWVVCRGIAIRDERGLAYRLAGSQTDITRRKSAEEQLLYGAFHDALTGLANRALFVNRLEHVIAASRRAPGQLYAVLFLDLDRFKVVNDSLGHAIGDHLLASVAQRLAACLRPSDTVARLGGDEFAVLLENLTGLADALQVVERIEAELSRRLQIDGQEVFAPASIGVALRADHYRHAEEVLRDADIAMYQAKLKGKGCHEVFDAEMHGSVVQRLKRESELRRAVEHGDGFVLHYQPIVELRTGELVGLEALLRWEHQAGHLLLPSEFVPIAEESGIIVRLGEWALRSACRQLRRWRDEEPELAGVRVSLNISGRQFRQPDLVARVARVLEEGGVEACDLALEVTESALMDDVAAAAGKLRRLREMGFQIHIDDFGTGYSSLSYLHRFPISALKIDRSFVAGLSEAGESDEIVKAIVSLATSLELDVIAEGVEEPAQLRRLQQLRCTHGQGYLFGRPTSAADLAATVRRQGAGRTRCVT